MAASPKDLRDIEVVNMHDAKTHLSKLVERVERGHEVIIARAGKPVAKLVPIVPVRRQRKLGFYRGKVWVSPDFDAPLPEEDFPGALA